jgi:hypothetical protein
MLRRAKQPFRVRLHPQPGGTAHATPSLAPLKGSLAATVLEGLCMLRFTPHLGFLKNPTCSLRSHPLGLASIRSPEGLRMLRFTPHLGFLLPPCWGALRLRSKLVSFTLKGCCARRGFAKTEVASFEGGYSMYPPSLPQQGGQKPNMLAHPFRGELARTITQEASPGGTSSTPQLFHYPYPFYPILDRVVKGNGAGQLAPRPIVGHNS